jgi:hypothetical protein
VSADTATPRACPTCGGLWLYGLTFDHVVTCALRAADDATVAADYWRLGFHSASYSMVRPATPTEQTLALALGMPQWTSLYGPTSTTPPIYCLLSGVTDSITRRRFRYGDDDRTLFDPDRSLTP